jgi:hypothetical protein
MTDKYGSYIQKLMSVILDEEQEEFVKNMSWEELKQIRDGLSGFLEKRKPKEPHEKKENPKQQLLFD